MGSKFIKLGRVILGYRSLGMGITGMLLCSMPTSLLAGPDGGSIVGGSGAIRHNGSTTTINQSSDLMAIDWQSYNVGSDERVQYIQPDDSSISLNRILSNNGSQIHGRIDANGQIFLVNPNGIVFGKNATIDVGGILASNLDINPNEFMNGSFAFSELTGADGKITNSGLINAATGGSVTLLGTQVKNDGLIIANLGAVNLAAGSEAVVTFDSAGLMGVRIAKEVLQDELGIDPAVVNSGEIKAESGRILLSGSVSEDIFTGAVNIHGQAKSVVVHDDGSFTLGSGADVSNTGKIDASSSSDNSAGRIALLGNNIVSSGEILANGQSGSIELHSFDTTLLTEVSITEAVAHEYGKGGDIKIFGGNVGLFNNSIVDVSGVHGGGRVFVGGDYQGANHFVKNARNTFVDAGVKIFSNAWTEGDGGRIIIWADGATRYLGSVEAQGGAGVGNGGFVEISGKELLIFNGSSFLSASNGNTGTLLLDPRNIDIASSGASTPATGDPLVYSFSQGSDNDVTISAGSIVTLLESNDLELQARADIRVSASIDASITSSSLTLTAGDDLQVNQPIIMGNGSLTLTAGSSDCDSACTGGGLLASGVFDGRALEINSNLSTNGGNIILNSFDRGSFFGTPIEGQTIINGNIAIGTGGGGGNIRFNDSLVSLDNTTSLTLTAGIGNIAFDGDVGSSSAYLSGLEIISAGTVTANNILTGSGGLRITATAIDLNGSQIYSSMSNTGGEISLTGAINLGSTVTVDATTGDNEGNVTFTGDVTGGSQNLSIYGGVIDIDGVDLSGVDNQIGGELNVTGSGSVTTGNIDTSGGISTGSGNGTSGQNGGDVYIAGGTLAVGVIDASGTDANDNDDRGGDQYDGGFGGTVQLTSTTGAVTIGGINTDGGNGDAIGGETFDDASGGNAGNIEITANGGVGQIYLDGDLTARGGRLHEEAGSNPSNGIVNGDSGEISLEGQRIILTGDVTIDTTLVPETGLSSAVAEAEPTDLIFNGTIDGTNSGGQSLVINAGNVWFNEAIGSSERIGSLEIDATGRLDATGRNINATSFSSVSTTFDSSDINTAGDTDMEGGNITVDASGRVSIGNITTEAGVRSADGDGYSGGNVELAGSAITVGEINTNGGTAGDGAGINNGGNAGTINITSRENNGEYSITLLGDVSAIGGGGVNGGLDGSSQTAYLNLVSTDQGGEVILSPMQSGNSFPTNFFSSNISISSSVGGSTLTGPAFADETLYWNITGNGVGTIDAVGDVPLDSETTRVQFNGFSTLNGSNTNEIFRIGDNSYTLTITAADGSDSEVVGPDSVNIWDIDVDGTTISGETDEPTISLFGFSKYTGNGQADTFDVNYGTFNGVLDGGEGADRLVVWDNDGASVLVGSNTPGGGRINTLNVEHIEVPVDTDSTLMVNGNGNNVWRLLADDDDGDTTLDGNNDGELQYNLVMDDDSNTPVPTSTISFFNFSTLSGNAGNDDFLIEDRAIFTGSINGDFFSSGEGRDTLQSNNSTGSSDWSISSLMSGTLLYGPDGNQSQFTFSNMHALTGGTATDTLRVVDDLASESGTWTVNASAPDSLSLTSDLDTTLEFDGIERLIGGSENDTFNIGDSIEYIDGGPGGDEFYVMAASIEAELVGGPQTGDSGDDVLVSHQDSSNFWTLDGPNSGSVNTGDAYDPIALVAFSWMEELQGASELDDVFEFTTPDQTAMEILGGEDGGIDTVRYGFTDQPVTLVITADGSDSTGVQGIENIVGNSFHESGEGTSTLMVTNAGSTSWEINAINGGEVEVGSEIITFSNFPGLVGGAGDDQFTVTSGSITVINGGIDGTDSIIGQAVDSEFNLGNNTDPYSGSVIALETATPYVAEFSNIDSFTGNGDNDRLNATELDFNLTVDLGGNTGTLTLTGIETIDANAGNDNTLIGRNSSSTWSINPGAHTLSDSSGTIEFSNFNHLVAVDGAGDTFDINDALTSVTGGNGADTFNIAASISNVYGGMGNDRFVLNANALATMLDGEGGTDYLTGFTTTSSWVINSSGSTSSISTGGVTINFRGMDNLNGRNDVTDTFKFNSFGSATGPNINAGGGETQDIVDYSDIDTALIIDIGSGDAFNGVVGAELLQGNFNHTLMASDGAAWRIYDFDGDGEDIADGANDGEVNGTQFVNFGSLRGGSGVDTFVFDGGTLSGNITGAGNNDTISRTVEGTTWEITGNDLGTFDDLGGTFSGISTLEGNAGADMFIFHGGSSWSGTVIGGDGAGEDVVESRHSASNIWNITGTGSGDISWLNEGGSDGFTGIESLVGSNGPDTFTLSGGSLASIVGAGGDDTLVALNGGSANSWTIDRDSGGSVDNLASFDEIEDLTGNSAQDIFTVYLAGRVRGVIRGEGSNQDTLDLTSFDTPQIVGIDGGAADFSTESVEVIRVNESLDNILNGGNSSRRWEIIGQNHIRIGGEGGPEYRGFSVLNGGNGSDEFVFLENGTLLSLDGNTHARIAGGGGAGTDIIAGPNIATIWHIDGAGEGDVTVLGNTADFDGIEQIQGGSAQDTFDISGSSSISIYGGTEADAGDIFNLLSEASFTGELQGEGGGDIFNLTGSALPANVIISGGTGDDSFNVYAANSYRLAGGGDDDALNLEHSAPAAWVINSASASHTAGAVQFSEMETLNGSNSRDTFNIQTAFAGEINGRDGDDSFNLNASVTSVNGNAGSDNFFIQRAGVDAVIDAGENYADVLTINHNQQSDWVINGADNEVTADNDGTSHTVGFTGFEIINGGANVDTFSLSASFGTINGRGAADIFNILADSITGILFGGNQDDQINVNVGGAHTWTVNTIGTNSTIDLNGGNTVWFDQIEILNGGTEGDTFIVNGEFDGSVDGRDGDDIFEIFADVLDGVFGGSGVDQFNMHSADLNITVDGGNSGIEMDTLALDFDADSHIWTVNGGDTDHVTSGSNTIIFSNIENALGGQGVDIFHVSVNTFNGSLDGRENNDIFNFTAGVAGEVNGGSGNDTFNIDSAGLSLNLVGGDGTEDIISLNHNALTNTWTINGDVNEVSNSVASVSFSEFEVARGNSNTDIFNIAGSFNRLEGRSGQDQFNIAGLGVNAIVVGGDDSDNLSIDIDGTNDWTIDGGAEEEVSNSNGGIIAFSEIEVLDGGTGSDNFIVSAPFTSAQSLNGNGGDDVYDLSNALNASLSGGANNDEFIIRDASFGYIIAGGDGDGDIVRAEHGSGNDWILDETSTMSVTGSGSPTSFTGIEVVRGGTGADRFQLVSDDVTDIDGRDGGDSYEIASEGLTVSIADSGIETDTDDLEGPNAETNWIIDGIDNNLANDDSNRVVFSGIERVSGNDASDRFTVTASIQEIFGQGGDDEFFIGANITNGIYGNDGDDIFAISTEGVSVEITGGADNDTVAGANSNSTNVWQLTNSNQGTLTNGAIVKFFEVENVTGGDGNDSFTYISNDSGTGGLDGAIDGGAHGEEGDSIDARALGGSLVVSMMPGDPASINFINVEEITVAEQDNRDWYNTLRGDNSENIWIFSGSNIGRVEDIDENLIFSFNGFQNVVAGTGSDTIRLSSADAGVDGIIFGGNGDPDFIDYSEIAEDYQAVLGDAPGGVVGIEGAIGYMPDTPGDGFERTLLVENDGEGEWLIGDYDGEGGIADGQDDGEYTFTRPNEESPTVLSFANFNRIIGGDGNDNFIFDVDASISGLINGGGGFNTVDADTRVVDGVGPSLVAQLNGNATGILNLRNIQSVTGNAGVDNVLIAGNVGTSHTWTIDDDNSGNINGIEFSNFANLTGSDTIADDFEFEGTAMVTGLIEGGSGAGDTVDLTGLSRDFDIIVQIGAVVNDYLNVNNVESINANPLNNNQLIAANRANTWNINGTNEGNIEHTGNVLPETSIAFDGFENLTGGSDSDLIILDGEDNVTGLIDGGAGEAGDELRLTGLTRDIAVVLDSRVGDAQSELNAIQFETISANGANVNTLVAGNDPNLAASTNNTWEIDAENEGRLNNTIDFIEFDNLVGGDTNDTFEFSLLGAITGYIDGGDESTEDVVDMSLLSAVSVTLGDGTNSLRDIERIVGNNRNSTLTADNIINEWNLTSGINDGTVNGLVFTDFNQLVGGSERDTFTINGGAVTGSIAGAGGNDVVNLTLPELATGELAFIGGDQNDTLIISGGNDNYSATYSPDVAGESRLVYSDTALNTYTVRYRTTETIQDNVVANSLTINGSVNAETITLANNNVVVDGFAQVNYDNKNNIVLAGAADDTVTIDGVVNVPGQLAIRNATVAANDDAMVVANSILFNATGQVGSPEERLTLDTGNIQVRSVNGDVYLENLDSVNIVELSTASRFDLVAAGQVSSNAALSSQGAVSITANNGNIELTNTSNAFQGPLNLNAANNNITLVNNSATDLAGIVSQTLNVTSGGAIVSSGPLLVNGLATFDSVADVTLDNSNNDFSSVSVLNANDVVVVDRNQLTLANFDGVGSLTTQSNGLVVNGVIQSANVAINAQAGTATLNNAINSTGAVTIEANGVGANDTISASSILLSDSAGGVNLAGVLRTDGGEIQINSDGSSVTQQGRISTSGGAITLNAANDIVMTGSAISESADGLISYSAGGNIDLTRIDAGEGTIALNSAGSVYDTQEGSADIIANRLEISSRTGISGTQIQSDFETDISELFVINNGGEVRIGNAGTVQVDRLRSNGDVTLSNETGDIIFNNQPDNTYTRGETDALLAGGVSNANYDQGFIAITSNQGSILALGSADSSQPDIVGRGARLLAIRGEVGAGNRPLVLHVRDSLFIHGFRSLTPFWSFGTEPLDFNDASTIKVDLLDLINLSGEQLVEVEELEEVNPAIFTAVTNYFYDDVSIRLPNDQLYEDELEELTALD